MAKKKLVFEATIETDGLTEEDMAILNTAPKIIGMELRPGVELVRFELTDVKEESDGQTANP